MRRGGSPSNPRCRKAPRKRLAKTLCVPCADRSRPAPTSSSCTPTIAGGRAKTAAYLRAAAKLFGGSDFRYVGQWYDDNDDGQIASFKVMLRPFKALQTVIPKMAELVQGT